MVDRPISILLLAVAILAWGSPCAVARLWTDITEKFHAEAEFVDLAGTSVRLLRTNGQTVDVPLVRLCPLGPGGHRATCHAEGWHPAPSNFPSWFRIAGR